MARPMSRWISCDRPSIFPFALLCTLLDIPDRAKIAAALSLGVALRLLQKTPAERYALHRLIREVRREDVPLSSRVEWAINISKKVASWFQALKRNFSDLPLFEIEVEHLRAWQENVQTFAPKLASRLVWLQAYPPFHRGTFNSSFSSS